jgi:hypothetical protein
VTALGEVRRERNDHVDHGRRLSGRWAPEGVIASISTLGRALGLTPAQLKAIWTT